MTPPPSPVLRIPLTPRLPKGLVCENTHPSSADGPFFWPYCPTSHSASRPWRSLQRSQQAAGSPPPGSHRRTRGFGVLSVLSKAPRFHSEAPSDRPVLHEDTCWDPSAAMVQRPSALLLPLPGSSRSSGLSSADGIVSNWWC